MEFKKGFKIKPKLILETGEVVFTDGTNDVFANEFTCKEYGYNYDTTTGTCYAYRYNNNLNKRAKNLDNKVLGIDNNINQTKYSLVNGTKNTTRGVSVNCFISGENNEITSDVSNVAILGGSHGLSLNQGEVLIGGGLLGSSETGSQQMSFVQLSKQSTTGSTVDLALQNGSTFISLQTSAIIGFEAHVIGLVLSGTDATPGQYRYYKITGACKSDASLNPTFTQSTTTIADGGLSPSAVPLFVASEESGFITVRCTGITNVNINWYASVHLYVNRTTLDF